MKFNEQHNKSLEELYRIARGYVNLAKAINDVADEINSLSGNETSDDHIKWYVPSQTAYVEDLVKACGVDTENLKAKLNDVKTAFED